MWFNNKQTEYHSTPLLRGIQIILLILIVIGITLLSTQKMWLPSLTNFLLTKGF